MTPAAPTSVVFAIRRPTVRVKGLSHLWTFSNRAGGHDPFNIFGGIAMKLPEEITHGDYGIIAHMLIAAGARLPSHVGGSDAVEDVLRRAGGPDGE